jgi:hypothetical protein
VEEGERMKTQSQRNLEQEIRQSIKSGIDSTVASMCRRSAASEASIIAKWSGEVLEEVFDSLRRHHRIGRPRRKQSELNP